ncbi:MAG TPA: cytochrome-c oxidase, cbb3-type subunit III [Povalibacter sp.]|nr:cytochrome-c oxidase, cbb3-type subunit III [Povalibacter sp.]
MSGFWSGWIKFLVVLNLGITFFLFIAAQRLKIPTQPDGTSGHVWAHGVLREGVRKLPLWWVLSSAAVFLWGFTYLALYPGFGSSQGLLGWTSHGEWQRELESNNARLESKQQPLRSMSIQQLADNADAVAIGHRLYLDNCAACHGSEARGNQALGAPNLTDEDWLYGGDGNTILASIQEGRNGAMPPWGDALGQEGVNEVASYVLSLRGTQAPADWVEAGKARFAMMCAACHGADGHGNPTLGAPNLTDDVWLYGGDFASVAASIRHGRSGVMPAWRGRLDEDQTRAVAAWVYSKAHGGAAR